MGDHYHRHSAFTPPAKKGGNVLNMLCKPTETDVNTMALPAQRHRMHYRTTTLPRPSRLEQRAHDFHAPVRAALGVARNAGVAEPGIDEVDGYPGGGLGSSSDGELTDG